jgi:hypothetical protein
MLRMVRRSRPAPPPCCPHFPGRRSLPRNMSCRVCWPPPTEIPSGLPPPLINGGFGDDGFEYFRGWLIVQGREVFERSVADPDSLADLPVIGPPTLDRPSIECEETLYIAMSAHRAATGAQLPADAFTIRYPEPDAGWDFDFDDRTKMERRLPRLTALCWPGVT